MAQSQQSGMFDRWQTDNQTKGINKRCVKPPIIMKVAVIALGKLNGTNPRMQGRMVTWAGPGHSHAYRKNTTYIRVSLAIY